MLAALLASTGNICAINPSLRDCTSTSDTPAIVWIVIAAAIIGLWAATIAAAFRSRLE